jgi:hypothetical protein
MLHLLFALGSIATGPRAARTSRAASAMMSTTVSAGSLKADLLDAVQYLSMGAKAKSLDKENVKSLVDQLVAMGDGVADPAAAFYSEADCAACAAGQYSIAGRWKLVYTDSPDVLALSLNPLAGLERIGQLCDARAKTITNAIEWKPPAILSSIPFDSLPFKMPYDPLAERLEQRIVLKAKSSPSTPRRVELSVEGLDLVPTRVFGQTAAAVELRSPLAAQLPFGSFDVLYLDDSLRIVKTVQGGFIAVNVRDELPAIDVVEAA